jgi:hypothetical protein
MDEGEDAATGHQRSGLADIAHNPDGGHGSRVLVEIVDLDETGSFEPGP